MTGMLDILYYRQPTNIPCQEIQEATASEPLTLDEEHAMQQSWRKDPDKLTFIICRPDEKLDQTSSVDGGMHDSPNAMIGDVNMFISWDEDGTGHQPLLIGELELMIADKAQQRKGSGRAALLTFLMYVLQNEAAITRQYWHGRHSQPPPSRFAYFSAKIGKENGHSLALFRSLGFTIISEAPNYWGEYELRHAALTPATIAKQMAERGICGYTELEYRRSD
jgi:hypothetical protein